jgi:hypothetical protein
MTQGEMVAAADLSIAEVTALREELEGDVVAPADATYDRARQVWNGVVDKYPALVAYCQSTNDVRTALSFAQGHGLPVAVRSGGHSYPGFSTCDKGIVIDLSAMRGVTVDAHRRVASVNGGALLVELDRSAQEHGLACPVGVVGHTGVAGLTLGGGLGRLQRGYGLTIDNLLGVEVVSADGKVVRAGPRENPDLFWGIRGAGANFGITVAFEFELHPIGPSILYGTAAYPIAEAERLGSQFRSYFASAPDAVGASFGFALGTNPPFSEEMAGIPYAFLSTTYCGDLSSAERVLRPLALPGAYFDTVGPKQYLDVQTMLDENMAWGRRYYTKSAYLETLTDEAIAECVLAMSDCPGDCSITIQALGGAVARVSDDAMAFSGRSARYWLSVLAIWDDPAVDAAYMAWGRDTLAAIVGGRSTGIYVNEVIETGDDVLRDAYGERKLRRLRELKRRYDPGNVFRLNQNIAPTVVGKA